MSKQIKRRDPGNRAFPSRPQLVVVPPAQQPSRPNVKIEVSEDVKEMLRELNRRQSTIRNSDAPDAA